MNDVIVEAEAGSCDLLNSENQLIGMSFTDFVSLLFEQYGSQVDEVSVTLDAGHIDRIVRIQDGFSPPIQLRVIMLPVFTTGGELLGVRGIFAKKTEEFVISGAALERD